MIIHYICSSYSRTAITNEVDSGQVLFRHLLQGLPLWYLTSFNTSVTKIEFRFNL